MLSEKGVPSTVVWTVQRWCVDCAAGPEESSSCAFMCYCSCVLGWIWEKTGLSALPGCLCIWTQSLNKDISTNSHSTTKRLKHSSNFESGENVRSSNVVKFKFELCHIPITDHRLSYRPLLLWSPLIGQSTESCSNDSVNCYILHLWLTLCLHCQQ